MGSDWQRKPGRPGGRGNVQPLAQRRRRRGFSLSRPGWSEVRLMLLGGLFLGLVAAQLARAPGPGSSPPAEASARFSPTQVRVIDGDTFDHEGVRIRIADIDTPEVRGRCAEESALAARATRRMAALLQEGPFELHPLPDGRDEDRYGRKLRIVTRDGRSLGDRLVAEGLARTWTGRREPWCV
jgi:endonuclease YncB( thermonuclease family)